jgi:hypothetical protein
MCLSCGPALLFIHIASECPGRAQPETKRSRWQAHSDSRTLTWRATDKACRVPGSAQRPRQPGVLQVCCCPRGRRPCPASCQSKCERPAPSSATHLERGRPVTAGRSLGGCCPSSAAPAHAGARARLPPRGRARGSLCIWRATRPDTLARGLARLVHGGHDGREVRQRRVRRQDAALPRNRRRGDRVVACAARTPRVNAPGDDPATKAGQHAAAGAPAQVKEPERRSAPTCRKHTTAAAHRPRGRRRRPRRRAARPGGRPASARSGERAHR